MLGHDLEPEDRSVRGCLVLGLSEEDISCLDVFEGDVWASFSTLGLSEFTERAFLEQEYSRKKVQVHPLGPIVPLAAYGVPEHRAPGSGAKENKADLMPSTPDPLPPNPSETLDPPIACETYIWASYPEELAKEPWSFHDFLQSSAWKWVPGEGSGAYHHEDYVEVDRRRAMEGTIVRG
jgi:hypothetical protein